MIKEKIKLLTKEIIYSLADQRGWPSFNLEEVAIERPANTEFGDYAINIAFDLAKQLGKSPQEIANELAGQINKNKPAEIERVEAVGGYVNFFLSADFVRNQLDEIYKNRDSFGKSDIGHGQKIIVEYSQPNIAKPIHIGHLRNTVLGDALANILEFSGYKVARWNYLGDWGTQFGKVITAYKLWGNKDEVKREPIKTLLDLYVKFHQELATSTSRRIELDRRGQEEFKKLEDGDKENRKLWEWFKKESVKELEKLYKVLGVKFDTWIGESFFQKELGPLVDDLLKQGVAEIGEEGAIIINLNAQGLPPGLIRKADGASLYLTRDIANLKYRVSKYKPTKILYVVGNEQSLHFEQLFAIAGILSLDKQELTHIKYGLVLGENKKKMSTREGEAVSIEEVIKKATNLAHDIVEKKSRRPDGSSGVGTPTKTSEEKAQIARTVALGALKYEMLKEHRNSDTVFDWQKMLDFRGNSAPYLQYTYARLLNITNKAGQYKLSKSDFNNLVEKSEMTIIKHLINFPEVIANSAHTYLTNNLALYLYELANMANNFYESTPILKDDDLARRNTRLALISTAASIFKTGLGLLGIVVLDKI